MHRYHTIGESKIGRRYDYKPSPANHPLKLALKGAPTPPVFKDAAPLPTAVDLSSFALPPRDQANEGSCSGFATAALREILETIHAGTPISGYLSPAYLYANARMLEGTFPDDSGATLADEMSGLVNKGVCPEALLPYDADPDETPDPEDDVAAQPYRVLQPQEVDFTNIDNLKACLAAKQPVVVGISVYESFETPDANGVVAMPGPTEKLLGGHAILLVGFDDATRLLKFRNSWGTSFAAGGYVFAPYEYISLIMEAMTAPVQ